MRSNYSGAALLLAAAASLPAASATVRTGAPPALASTAAVPDSLEQRLKACTACHAPKDRHDAYFPRIAGKPAGYLYHQLLNFRDGRRQYPLMTYMVEHLPDAYLREIASYFADQHTLPMPAQPGNASAAVLARGRQLVQAGDQAKKIPACASCHGARLGGVAPAIPGLLGLPRDYINAQFGAWKNGMRRAHAPDCMAQIAQRLSDADVSAISSWLASQAAAPEARPASSTALPLPMQCGSVAAASAAAP